MTAATEASPDGGHAPLARGPCRILGENVLVEPKLTAWSDDSEELGKRVRRVGYRAQHERSDAGIEA